MASMHKLSVDTAALFLSRAKLSSQTSKHVTTKRSRSHGSSPLPTRSHLPFSGGTCEQVDLRPVRQTSQSPIFARSSRHSQESILDNVEDPVSIKERTTSSCEKDPASDGEKKPKKKNSLVKNLLVNRLRSGSWHASLNFDSSKHVSDLEKVRPNAETATGKFASDSCDKELTELVTNILDSHLNNEKYDCNQASAKCGVLSEFIGGAVKSRLNKGGKSFKVSTLVYLGEVKEDGIKMATQCAWEPNQDHFAMATYESEHLFASAMVFAVEFDEGFDADYL